MDLLHLQKALGASFLSDTSRYFQIMEQGQPALDLCATDKSSQRLNFCSGRV